ncbi:MAG TPA: hypothetical protein VFG80_08085 [Myxococcota bacterium]|nr:hypothetical protein [Myxococcota bacterium]
MMRPTLLGAGILAASVVVLAPPVPAEDLDASRPLHCALAEAAQCDRAARCGAVTLEEVDLPGAVRIDFAGKQLASDDGQRTSPIAALEVGEAVLVLQGHQNGRGWLAVVERATGHLTATVADAEGSFVLSGGCAAAP